MERIEQLKEDTKIVFIYIAYCLYLVSSFVILVLSLSGVLGVLVGFMGFFTSSVGVTLCLLMLWEHRERLRELEVILPKKIQRKIKKRRRRREGEDFFG